MSDLQRDLLIMLSVTLTENYVIVLTRHSQDTLNVSVGDYGYMQG